jgi:hypothetical protein
LEKKENQRGIETQELKTILGLIVCAISCLRVEETQTFDMTCEELAKRINRIGKSI